METTINRLKNIEYFGELIDKRIHKILNRLKNSFPVPPRAIIKLSTKLGGLLTIQVRLLKELEEIEQEMKNNAK